MTTTISPAALAAAPANLLPRFVLGAQPLTPGWRRALIRPNPGNLKLAEGRIPTPRGPILVSWRNDASFNLTLTLPKGVSAQVELPSKENSRGVLIGDQPARAHRVEARWRLDEEISGSRTLEVR